MDEPLTYSQTHSRLSFLPYFGGKQRLIKTILPLLPEHVRYVEVFGGSAALLLNKPPSPVEVYNDIDGLLVNLFLVVRDHPQEFARCVQSLPYSRQLYERWQRQVKNGRLTGNQIEQAVRFYYMLRSSFFAHVEKGWRFATKTDEASRLYNCVGEVETIARRLQHVYIDNLDFRRCIRNWDRPDTIFFLDPPYFETVAYRKAVKAFTAQDHEELAKLLHGVDGKWLLTYNDEVRVRALYKDFEMIEIATSLNTDKMAVKRRLQRQLIITNYHPRKVAKQAHADNRGNGRCETTDAYDHIDTEEFRRVCLTHIPQG
jgi:DNA adenine methylase